MVTSIDTISSKQNQKQFEPNVVSRRHKMNDFHIELVISLSEYYEISSRFMILSAKNQELKSYLAEAKTYLAKGCGWKSGIYLQPRIKGAILVH